MRHSISIAVMAVALIVGCGSDKSTGPELTLAEKLVGEWEGKVAGLEGTHIMVFYENGEYKATFVSEDESVFTEGVWEVLPGDLLKIEYTGSTDLLTGELSDFDFEFTRSASIEGDKLTLTWLDGDLPSDTYTRKN
jgi:hypothetical protein